MINIDPNEHVYSPMLKVDPNEHVYSPMLKGVFNSDRIRLLNKNISFASEPLSIRHHNERCFGQFALQTSSGAGAGVGGLGGAGGRRSNVKCWCC